MYTSFHIACEMFGYEKVMEVVEETLVHSSSSSSSLDDTPPLNIADALITAAIDEYVHLDCVYFLLRREPDVLQKLLSSTQAAGSNNNNNNNDENDSDDDGNDGNSNDNLLVTGAMNLNKKRKRK
jgi:hypothetical protein